MKEELCGFSITNRSRKTDEYENITSMFLSFENKLKLDFCLQISMEYNNVFMKITY